MKKGNILIILGILGALAILSLVFVLIWHTGKTSQQNFDTKTYVAVINGEAIKKSTYEQQIQQRDYFVDWLKTNNTTSQVLQTPVIDALIDQTITIQFAKEQNLLPTDLEIQQKYQAAVASVGTETQYLSKMQSLQGVGKDEILTRIKLEIVQTNIEARTRLPFTIWLNEQKQKTTIVKANNL